MSFMIDEDDVEEAVRALHSYVSRSRSSGPFDVAGARQPAESVAK